MGERGTPARSYANRGEAPCRDQGKLAGIVHLDFLDGRGRTARQGRAVARAILEGYAVHEDRARHGQIEIARHRDGCRRGQRRRRFGRIVPAEDFYGARHGASRHQGHGGGLRLRMYLAHPDTFPSRRNGQRASKRGLGQRPRQAAVGVVAVSRADVVGASHLFACRREVRGPLRGLRLQPIPQRRQGRPADPE